MDRANKVSIEELLSSDVDICFVAMDFSPAFDPVYDEIIGPAISDSGMRAVRGDSIISAGGDIMEEVTTLVRAPE